jgi:hypothetical protein
MNINKIFLNVQVLQSVLVHTCMLTYKRQKTNDIPEFFYFPFSYVNKKRKSTKIWKQSLVIFSLS